MSQQLDQVIARAEAILAQCMVAANQAAAAAASIGSAGLAPLESPLFTGDPRAPTPASGDASASIATTAWIGAKLAQPDGIATLGSNGVVPLDQLPFAGLTAKGTWNAATNTPTLSAGTAGNTNGDFYIVTVSGSTNLSGITTWNVGDWALFSAGVWTRVPYTAPPVSNLPLSSLEAIGPGTVVANTTSGTLAPAAILISSIMGYLGVVTTGGSGLCPTLPGGTATFLRSDGTWVPLGAPDLSAYALLNSPAFTGTATVATQARTTMSSAIASTQFIFNQLAGTGEAGLIQQNSVTAASGTAPYLARIDHVHQSDSTRAANVNPAMSGSAGSYNGTLTIGPRTTVGGTTTITGTMSGTVSGNLTRNGNDTVNGTLAVNGTMTVAGTATITGTLIVNGSAVDAGSSFPSGTLMLFQQNAAPTGWTKQTTHNDKALRVVSGTPSSGGSIAFSTVFGKTATDTLALTTAHMPTSVVTDVDASSSNSFGDGGGGAVTSVGVTKGGSGSAHSHGMDIRVQYVDLIIAQKN